MCHDLARSLQRPQVDLQSFGTFQTFVRMFFKGLKIRGWLWFKATTTSGWLSALQSLRTFSEPQRPQLVRINLKGAQDLARTTLGATGRPLDDLRSFGYHIVFLNGSTSHSCPGVTRHWLLLIICTAIQVVFGLFWAKYSSLLVDCLCNCNNNYNHVLSVQK